MKNIFIIAFVLAVFGSCTKTIYVPTTEYIKGKDSIVIKTKDSLIYVSAPPQFNENITNQRSHLETDYSLSNAWIDSVGLLHHNIQNVAKIPLKIIYKDVYRVKVDSVIKTKTISIEKKVPVTPTWCWWLLASIGGYFAFKFRKFFGSQI